MSVRELLSETYLLYESLRIIKIHRIDEPNEAERMGKVIDRCPSTILPRCQCARISVRELLSETYLLYESFWPKPG